METPAEKQARNNFAHTMAVAVRDHERLTWLNQVGRWLTPHADDAFKSYHEQRKTAHFYVNGAYTMAHGNDAREAIDRAMEITRGR